MAGYEFATASSHYTTHMFHGTNLGHALIRATVDGHIKYLVYRLNFVNLPSDGNPSYLCCPLGPHRSRHLGCGSNGLRTSYKIQKARSKPRLSASRLRDRVLRQCGVATANATLGNKTPANFALGMSSRSKKSQGGRGYDSELPLAGCGLF